jgi:hypothetical protein
MLQFIHIVTTTIVSLSLVGAPASASPSAPPVPDCATKVKLASSQFAELCAALQEAHGVITESVIASVCEEELRTKKSEEKGGTDWRCQPELDSTIDKCKNLKRELTKLVQRVENKWSAAQGTAKGCAEEKYPWDGQQAEVASAVKALKPVFNDVNSSRTASKNKLAKLWSNVQDYAGKLPKCLPAVKAIDLMPATVNVPCISKSVTIHG